MKQKGRDYVHPWHYFILSLTVCTPGIPSVGSKELSTRIMIKVVAAHKFPARTNKVRQGYVKHSHSSLITHVEITIRCNTQIVWGSEGSFCCSTTTMYREPLNSSKHQSRVPWEHGVSHWWLVHHHQRNHVDLEFQQ